MKTEILNRTLDFYTKFYSKENLALLERHSRHIEVVDTKVGILDQDGYMSDLDEENYNVRINIYCVRGCDGEGYPDNSLEAESFSIEEVNGKTFKEVDIGLIMKLHESIEVTYPRLDIGE